MNPSIFLNSQKDKLVSDLATAIVKYIDNYKTMYSHDIKDYHNSFPNNGDDPLETFKNVCKYNLVVANSNDLTILDNKIIYNNKNGGMIFVMDETTNQLIALAKYSIKDLDDREYIFKNNKIHHSFMVNYNDKMIYIEVRCVSPAVRRRGLSEFLIALILFYLFRTDNIAGVIGSMDASDVEQVDINEIPHSKHMKGYAGCRIHEYRYYYYQDVITATNMVVKCLTVGCTDSDWEKVC